MVAASTALQRCLQRAHIAIRLIIADTETQHFRMIGKCRGAGTATMRKLLHNMQRVTVAHQLHLVTAWVAQR
jgi:hypothetical protein